MTQEPKQAELLPCPFCGSPASIRDRATPFHPAKGISCDNLHCVSAWTGWHEGDEAIRKWNTRQPAVADESSITDEDIDHAVRHGFGDRIADALSTPQSETEKLREGERRAIARIVHAAQVIAFQAGVGGRETAGAIVSYLATSPDEIAPFMDGDLSPIDFAGDWMRGGCLSWHAANGEVVHPDASAALAEARS